MFIYTNNSPYLTIGIEVVMIEDTTHGLVGIRGFGLRHGRGIIRVYGLMYVPANSATKINPSVTFQAKSWLERTIHFI